MSAAQRLLFARGSPIWAYHKIAAPPTVTTDPFLYSTPEQFDWHLARLSEAGYQFVRLDGFLGSPAVPGTRVNVITFDDGFLNVLRNGLEILARHKAKAIQFLVADALGGQNHWDVAAGDTPEPIMDAAGVREWLAAGHDIGSHSLTHRNLKELPAAELTEEISGSKKKLEDIFGVPIRHFAYPFGGCNPRVRDAVLEAGYATACTMDFGVNGSDLLPLQLRRIIPLSGRLVLRKAVHRIGRRFANPRLRKRNRPSAYLRRLQPST